MPNVAPFRRELFIFATMTAKHIIPLSFSTGICILSGLCSTRNRSVEPIEYPCPEIIRLEKVIADADSEAISNNYEGLSMFLSMTGINTGTDMTDLTEAVVSYSQSAGFSYFLHDVLTHFESVDTLARQLAYLKSNWSVSSFPQKIFTVVSPYRQRIMTVDSTALFIALNHYMGEDYPPYEAFPRYIRATKIPGRIAYDVSEALISATFPYPESETSFASRMVYQGVILLNAMQSVADADLANALGWSSEQMNKVTDNERSIWQEIIERNWLYADTYSVPAQLLEPAPSVPQLSVEVPGGVARFLGYKIVESYFKSHPTETVHQFLASKKYLDPDILRQASYRP